MVALWTVPSLGPVTVLEAAWLLAGLLAVLVCTPHLPALWADYRDAREARRRPLTVVARGNLRREVVRVTFGLVITAIGVLAAAQPPATPGPARISELGLLVTAGLLWVAYGSSLMSWWDWRDRLEVEEALAQSRQT